DRPSGDIFGFPKGPEPGTAIHHIFEHIDFADSINWDAVISKYLQKQDINERWQPVVRKMLQKTVHKSLIKEDPGLNLAAIPSNQMIAEMAFNFTVNHTEMQDLLSIIRPGEPPNFAPKGFADDGFLKGFIDLTFQFEGK